MEATMSTFGSYFKKLRLASNLTLRKYCEKHELDAAQISRLERDLHAAPKDPVKLEFYAKSLGLKPGSKEWKKLFELASVSNKSVIANIKTPALIEKLPIFLRTIDNKNLDADKLDKLIELIKKS
jgi:transcriptional regulator with XRE-family HTH domain